jgi:hypothetical protein
MSALSVVVPISSFGGLGTLSGSSQTVERILTQTDHGGGIILVDGAETSLASAQSTFAADLSTNVGADLRLTGSSSGGVGDTIAFVVIE